MLKGRVVSYIPNKKYGFVNGEDGESYFLHVSGLQDSSDESKLIKDVVVEFDPTPTARGLAAKKVSIPNVYFKKKMVNFFTTKNHTPKYGTVEKRLSISTRFFKDFKEGREHIEKLAKDAGCNAILDLNFEKETFSSGNYKYTVYAFKGDFSVVTESEPCDTQAQVSNSVSDVDGQIEHVENKFKKIHELETEARAKQLKKSNVGLYFFLIVFAVIFVSAMA